MRDLLNGLLKVCVVLYVDAVGDDDVRDVACLVDINSVDFYFYFCPVIHNYSLKNFFRVSKKLLRLA